MYLFSAHNITKNYAAHTALKNVSIDVSAQTIFGLLGPNGAGKTSLIRIINQITAPDEGELYFNGEKLKPHHISLIGYLPEERGLYKKMKVGEQALYLAQLKGVPKAEALKKLKYWFEKFEILDWWNKKVEELSKGMQQKIQFIVTILHEPKLLIFDEPFSGFDPINVNLLKEEILNLRNNGATIIFSTHNMESVEELCDNIALINKAEKILDGKVHEIKNTYKANIFEIGYNKQEINFNEIVPQSYEILSDIHQNGISKIQIKIPADEMPNQLIKYLIPHMEMHSFNEILPSMNDIFIQKVNEQKQKSF
ncbi:MAG: ABC transporter ATP-binding protein [Bacteroidetes bacterium]|nr:ABC transporter ATP-binding protein [Bacteroidota bacterium]